jgi:hypothetical protein
MHDSRRYRDNAAQCLLAAQEACQPYYRKLRLSMADSWLSPARQDEAMDNLLASWDAAAPVKTEGLGASSRSTTLRFRCRAPWKIAPLASRGIAPSLG